MKTSTAIIRYIVNRRSGNAQPKWKAITKNTQAWLFYDRVGIAQ